VPGPSPWLAPALPPPDWRTLLIPPAGAERLRELRLPGGASGRWGRRSAATRRSSIPTAGRCRRRSRGRRRRGSTARSSCPGERVGCRIRRCRPACRHGLGLCAVRTALRLRAP
jgi:hypothetical protein